MDSESRFFSINGLKLSQGGVKKNVHIDSEGALTVAGIKSGGSFIFSSLDSSEKGMPWHRIVLDCEVPDNTFMRLSLYVSEEKSIVMENRLIDLDSYFSDDSIDVEDKLELFDRLAVISLDNAKDALIHNLKGRYIWIKVDMSGSSAAYPLIRKIRIYFPVQSFVQYLPEIYQKGEPGEFLGRFLGIFQSLYLDMEEKIDSISRYFDPDCVSGEFLEFLSSWLGVENSQIWNEEQLRGLTSKAVRLYKIKGTRKGIEELVEAYTGEKPYIVEHFQLESSNTGIKDLMKRLYSDNPYIFTVIVKQQNAANQKAVADLRKIIDSVKPAHTMANLVVLKPYIHLDGYSYLGVNSYLDKPLPLRLDGLNTLSHNTILGD